MIRIHFMRKKNLISTKENQKHTNRERTAELKLFDQSNLEQSATNGNKDAGRWKPLDSDGV